MCLKIPDTILSKIVLQSRNQGCEGIKCVRTEDFSPQTTWHRILKPQVAGPTIICSHEQCSVQHKILQWSDLRHVSRVTRLWSRKSTWRREILEKNLCFEEFFVNFFLPLSSWYTVVSVGINTCFIPRLWIKAGFFFEPIILAQPNEHTVLQYLPCK